MRRLSILLMVFIGLHALYQPLVLLGFYAAQDYLAANHCVQKDVPDNCCQASCVLDESLDVWDKAAQYLSLYMEINYFSTGVLAGPMRDFIEASYPLAHYFKLKKLLSQRFSAALLKPPQ